MKLPHVYAFYSVKGGVGKSALAVAAALGFAQRGRPVAVIDADFMGTSLAEGLSLEGPEAREPTYINAFVLQAADGFDPEKHAWSHPSTPDVRWFPSSPEAADVERAAELVFTARAAETGTRLHRVVTAIASATEGERPVVLVDLPPGLFGLPVVVMRAFSTSREVWDFTPVLVTTPDRNDLLRSVREFPRLFAPRGAVWLLNRDRGAPERTRDQVREALPALLRDSGLERSLRSVGWREEGLGRLYTQPELSLPDATTSLVVDLLERI